LISLVYLVRNLISGPISLPLISIGIKRSSSDPDLPDRIWVDPFLPTPVHL
jgi:hypothetical protein